MSKSKIDPVLQSGNLTMGQVDSMFQRLILETKDLQSTENIGRKYGLVVSYSEEKGASNPSLKNAIRNFINGREPIPQGARPDLDTTVGDNLTLLLIRANNVQNLGQENEMAMDSDLSTHWTTLNLKKNNEEIEIRYADSIGHHNGKDEIPAVIKQALEEFRISSVTSQKDFSSTRQTDANCGYMAVWHALSMHEVEASFTDNHEEFIKTQRSFLLIQEGQPTDQNHEEDFNLAAKAEEQKQDQLIPSQFKIDASRGIITSRRMPILGNGTNTTNWMGKIDNSLKLSELSIPGTHDSGATENGPSLGMARCHDLTISEQLNQGIRFLDVRCRHINDVFTIHHGPIYQKKNFGGVLENCREFLRNNPSECIIMSIKEEHEEKNCRRQFAETFEARYIKGEGKNPDNRGLWYLEKNIPTLEEARGKIVLLRRFQGSDIGIDASNWRDNNRSFEAGQVCCVQDRYKVGDSKEKIKAIENAINQFSEIENKLCLNFTSCNRPPNPKVIGKTIGAAFASAAGGALDDAVGKVTSFFTFRLVKKPTNLAKKAYDNIKPTCTPKEFSEKINPELINLFRGHKKLGIVVMDFPELVPNLIPHIVNSNTRFQRMEQNTSDQTTNLVRSPSQIQLKTLGKTAYLGGKSP